MKTDTLPLLPGTFYHIYNRAIGNEVIFREDKNYSFFLNKFAQFVSPVVDTYAYCLLSNHFHLLIRTKSVDEILEFKKTQQFSPTETIPLTSKILGQQFGSFFKSYTNSINKTYDRTGGLFEESFRRKVVTDLEYLSHLIYYIHYNPQKHGFCEDYREYPYSSYHSHLSQSKTKLRRDQVLTLFGSKNQFQLFHQNHHDLRAIQDLLIELHS